MENLDTPAPAPSENADLKAQVDSLRHVVISALVLLIIVSGTLNLFLLRQAKYARADLAAIRPQVSQLVAEYNKTTAPVVNEFARQLVEFGQKNPDFMPIVTKYGLARQATNAPAATKAPVSPAPATKK